MPVICLRTHIVRKKGESNFYLFIFASKLFKFIVLHTQQNYNILQHDGYWGVRQKNKILAGGFLSNVKGLSNVQASCNVLFSSSFLRTDELLEDWLWIT